MMEKIYSAEHPHKSFILNNIGFAYSYLNEHQQALEFHLKALKMNETLYENKDHPDLARSLYNVGKAYENLNDHLKMLDFKVKGLQMFQRLVYYSNNSNANTTDLIRTLFNSGKSILIYKNKYFKLKYFEYDEFQYFKIR
jgi:tetratricopeptide (TPR) repeat protein